MQTKIKLTKKQEIYLSKIKRKNNSGLIRDRAHVILLRNNNKTIEYIAEALLRSTDFVVKAIKRFNNGELENIALTGHNYKLTKKKRDNIIDMIANESPNELKGFSFKDQFWTTDILRIVIERKHGITYKTEKSYYDLFAAAGFSFHKPKTKDFRQDPSKLKEFKGALKKSSETTRIRLSW